VLKVKSDHHLDESMSELIAFLEKDLDFTKSYLQEIALLPAVRQAIEPKHRLLDKLHIEYDLSSPHLKERVKVLILEHKLLLSGYL
jgi:hypothetical protein